MKKSDVSSRVPQVSEAVLLRRRIEDCLRKNPTALELVGKLLKKEGFIK
jgi:hypothetical protein